MIEHGLFFKVDHNPTAEMCVVILALAFAASCLWLAVRLYNRRERWAKWTLASAIGLPVLYVLSFGPACQLADRRSLSEEFVLRLYYPLGVLIKKSGSESLYDLMVDFGMEDGIDRGGIPIAMRVISDH
jgi:hypothetical protein